MNNEIINVCGITGVKQFKKINKLLISIHDAAEEVMNTGRYPSHIILSERAYWTMRNISDGEVINCPSGKLKVLIDPTMKKHFRFAYDTIN